MKTIIINASPRKSWNTAKLLKEANKGAERAGHLVEYIDLYDITSTGCHSCMACKRKGLQNPCKCYWPDQLTAVLDNIYQADRLIIGSPVYYNQTTSRFHALMERLCFPAMSYNNYKSTFNGKVDVDVFLTMNVNREYYEQHYKSKFADEFRPFRYLNGTTTVHGFCDTLQVRDYSLFDMAAWDENHKRKVHQEQFPIDLQTAFEIGAGNK